MTVKKKKKKTPPRDSSGQFRKRKKNKPAGRPAKKTPKRKGNPGMAQTAVVNRRRKNKRKAPKRYGSAKKRRRNPAPASKYSSGGYYRRPNPDGVRGVMDMDTYYRILPAGTAGIWAARWAVKMAGDFEPNAEGVPVPGVKHAIAIAIASAVAPKFIANLLGGRGSKEIEIAQIAAISYGGDLFARTRVFNKNQWVQDNISLGDNREYEYATQQAPADMSGMGADTYTDPAGNKYVRSGTGWALAGDWDFGAVELPPDAETGDIVQAEDGEMYEVMEGGNVSSRPDLNGTMGAFEATSPLGGFEASSPLGGVAPASNSFGYAAA